MSEEKKDKKVQSKQRTPKQLIVDMEKAEKEIANLELDLRRAKAYLEDVKRMIVKQVMPQGSTGKVFNAAIDNKIYECSKVGNTYNIIPK